MYTREAAAACVLLAVGALVAGGRKWRRPSHDRMFDGLVIAMPWLAHGWLVQYNGSSTVATHGVALAMALAFLVVNLFVGVKRRQHAPLIGTLGNLACVAYSTYRLMPWPNALAADCGRCPCLLAVVVLLERLLRHRSKGITSRAIEESVQCGFRAGRGRGASLACSRFASTGWCAGAGRRVWRWRGEWQVLNAGVHQTGTTPKRLMVRTFHPLAE
ncbi:hypothetical protein [Candidatus Accumulibacter sp. ACC005]|uniref:hypothetical protein n=1 Tax=Candidatus Accumulibacter sp. ACC005 TaxID=2823331 RepID=UPI0025B86482|nr:hypothetical protein [Candidatus Accumulibacter sp. ACC005]